MCKLEKFIIIFVFSWFIISAAIAKNTTGYRSRRSISILPSFFGGSSDSAIQESTESINRPRPLNSKLISPHYPVYKVYKYNGINLRPVHPSQVQHLSPIKGGRGVLNQNQIPVIDPRSPLQKQTMTKNNFAQLPSDLRKLASSLGLNDGQNVPSLKEISSWLGTSSEAETINFIREIASTEDGVEMIRSFVQSAQQPNEVDIHQNYGHMEKEPVHEQTARILVPPSVFPTFGSVLDRTHTDLGLLKTVVATPAPSGGFFDSLSSLGSYFKIRNNNLSPLETGNAGPHGPISHKISEQPPQTAVFHTNRLPPAPELPTVVGVIPHVNFHLPAQYLPQPPTYGNRYTYKAINQKPEVVSQVQRVPQQIFRSPPINNYNSINQQLAKFPLDYTNDAHRLSTSKHPALDSYGNPIPIRDAFVAASEIQVAYEPPPQTISRATDVPSMNADETKVLTLPTGNEQNNLFGPKPRRVSGFEAHATGKVYRAHPDDIDLPLTLWSTETFNKENIETIDEKMPISTLKEESHKEENPTTTL